MILTHQTSVSSLEYTLTVLGIREHLLRHHCLIEIEIEGN